MKKHKEHEEQLFKDKKMEQRVVAATLLGLSLYFAFQAYQYFIVR